MFIEKLLPSRFNFASSTSDETIETNDSDLNKQIDKIYNYNLSKAIISSVQNQIQLEIVGKSKVLFNNEKDLDSHLYSLREEVDIWKIKDERKIKSKTIYKYIDPAWEIVSTFTKKNSLYYDISSENSGIFKIKDLNKSKKKYIRKNTKWLFFWNFEKIDKSAAQLCAKNREKSISTWNKIYAVGFATLSLTPTILTLGASVSRGISAISSKIKDLSLQNNSVNPNVLTFLAANILISSFTQKNSLARFTLSMLSTAKLANAQIFCPNVLSTHPLPDTPHSIYLDYPEVRIGTNSKWIKVDASNYSNPITTHETSIPNPSRYQLKEIANLNNIDFIAAGQGVFAIDTITGSIVGFYNSSATNAIAISNNLAYINFDWQSFQALNISTLSNIFPVGSINGINFSSKRIFVSNNIAYSIGPYLMTLDVTNDTPVYLGYTSIPGIVNDAYKLGNIIITVGTHLNVFDVSIPNSPQLIKSDSCFPSIARAMTVYKGVGFVVQPELLVYVNMDNPRDPYPFGNYSIPISGQIKIHNETLFSTGSNPNRLYIVKLECFSSTTSSESSTTSSLTSSSSRSSTSSKSSSTTSSSKSSSKSSSSEKSSGSSNTTYPSIPTTTTRSDSSSTVDVSTNETKATINNATVSNSSTSVTDVATKNMFTTKSSSNSTKRTWIPWVIISSFIIIPASILAFLKLRKKKSSHEENELEVIPTPFPPPGAPPSHESDSDEDPTYANLSQFQIQGSQGGLEGQGGQARTYSKLLDVALERERQNAEDQYANRPIRENF